LKKTLLAIAQVVWPPVAAWLVIELPTDAFSKFVKREIERRSDAKLKAMTAELQAPYSGVNCQISGPGKTAIRNINLARQRRTKAGRFSQFSMLINGGPLSGSRS